MSNKLDQKERRELAGSTGTTTYFAQARIAQELELGGRFAVEETINTGAEAATMYPRLPSGPWTGPQPGLEEPLGQDVNFQEPCGNAHEIEASLVLAAGTVPGSEKLAEVAPLVASSPADVETPRPISSVEERLAELLPRLAVPKPNRRKV
jgi:hypothetical protein